MYTKKYMYYPNQIPIFFLFFYLLYRDEQLQKALSILLLPGQSTGTVQEALVTISNSEENNKRVPKDKLMLYQDPISHWWSSVLSISANWMLNQVSEASHFYQEMDSVPFFQDEDSKLS